MDDQILIIFGMNILDATGLQMTIYVPASPNLYFCTTWGTQNKQNITFLFTAISLFDSNEITHIWHILSKFLALWLTVYLIVQLCNC